MMMRRQFKDLGTPIPADHPNVSPALPNANWTCWDLWPRDWTIVRSRHGCLSEGTVRNRISDILAKTNISNRTKLAVEWLAWH